MKFLIFSTALLVLILTLVVVVPHRHNENCKWIAPLKVNYVLCSDGKVREK